ncbi:hypothetical protein GWI33_017646 [Rhynchophorus ferrugineus]|uniref:C2H2-type domain-containing protein n=1 Tax=Rhynchophorus ferrugineus TaxID=354439 RepID=A0A834M8Y7_RHYFE|nr:hypothetical protein GWI33_017646 [Rhynchophorus ferrugineus]
MTLFTCLICLKEISENNAHSIDNNIINSSTVLQAIEELISCQYSDQIISPQYVCKNILKSIYNEDLLKQVHQGTELVKESFGNECKYCGIKIKDEENFAAHTCKNKELVKSSIYSCALCSKKFTRKEYLIVHNRTHTGEKPYHCNTCNKDFSQQASFYVHKRRLHDKVVLGTCNYCGKKFVDKSALENHIKMWHTGERSYLCEICSATFVCNRTLQRHLKELHNEKKPCQKCGKMLGDYALKKHLHRHQVQEGTAEISKKKYTCEYCNIIINFTSRRRHLEKQHNIKLLGRGEDCMKIPIKTNRKSL